MPHQHCLFQLWSAHIGLMSASSCVEGIALHMMVLGISGLLAHFQLTPGGKRACMLSLAPAPPSAPALLRRRFGGTNSRLYVGQAGAGTCSLDPACVGAVQQGPGPVLPFPRHQPAQPAYKACGTVPAVAFSWLCARPGLPDALGCDQHATHHREAAGECFETCWLCASFAASLPSWQTRLDAATITPALAPAAVTDGARQRRNVLFEFFLSRPQADAVQAFDFNNPKQASAACDGARAPKAGSILSETSQHPKQSKAAESLTTEMGSLQTSSTTAPCDGHLRGPAQDEAVTAVSTREGPLCIICLAPMEASEHGRPAARGQQTPGAHALASRQHEGSENDAAAGLASDQMHGIAEPLAGSDRENLSRRVEQGCCRSCRQQILNPMKPRRGPSGHNSVAELLPSVFLDRLARTYVGQGTL